MHVCYIWPGLDSVRMLRKPPPRRAYNTAYKNVPRYFLDVDEGRSARRGGERESCVRSVAKSVFSYGVGCMKTFLVMGWDVLKSCLSSVRCRKN